MTDYNTTKFEKEFFKIKQNLKELASSLNDINERPVSVNSNQIKELIMQNRNYLRKIVASSNINDVDLAKLNVKFFNHYSIGKLEETVYTVILKKIKHRSEEGYRDVFFKEIPFLNVSTYSHPEIWKALRSLIESKGLCIDSVDSNGFIISWKEDGEE